MQRVLQRLCGNFVRSIVRWTDFEEIGWICKSRENIALEQVLMTVQRDLLDSIVELTATLYHLAQGQYSLKISQNSANYLSYFLSHWANYVVII